jgi:hypothetical protein
MLLNVAAVTVLVAVVTGDNGKIVLAPVWYVLNSAYLCGNSATPN